MAIFKSDSFVGIKTLPSSDHAGQVQAHRCKLNFKSATTFAANDQIVLGRIPDSCVIDSIKTDVTNLPNAITVNLLLVDDVDSPTTSTILATGVELKNAAAVQNVVMDLSGEKFQGSQKELALVAKVTTGAATGANAEIGITFRYRTAQSTS